jgi:dephospho-CoA kinase
MLKVGLTGNIGSGKTVVARVFSKLGVAVFHADTEARKLFENVKIKEDVRKIFGPVVFTSSGEVIRPALAEIVFNDPLLLDKLNQVIHPAVRDEYLQWCHNYAAEPYTLYEAAVLFESGHYHEMDKVICVTAPEELRISRVMERDKVSRQEVEKRMANQWKEEKKVALSDYVIRNDESNMVITQVMEIHKILIQSSKLKVQS